MNMKQSCKALICAIEGELDGRHCTEEQAAAILDHALPSLTEALARMEAEHADDVQRYRQLLNEAGRDRYAAQKKLAEAVGLLREVNSQRFTSPATVDIIESFIGRHSQIFHDQEQAKHQEAQGAQAGDEPVGTFKSFEALLKNIEATWFAGADLIRSRDTAQRKEIIELRAALATQPAAGVPAPEFFVEFATLRRAMSIYGLSAPESNHELGSRMERYAIRVIEAVARLPFPTTAAAHGDGLSFSTVDELAEAIRQVSAYEELGPELIAEEIFKQAGAADAAHGDEYEIWSAAQLAPGEGIEDGAERIRALICKPAAHGDEAVRKDAERLDFILTKCRKVVVEMLPRGRDVYVEEGVMGERTYPAVHRDKDWPAGSAEDFAIKRQAIDAAMRAQGDGEAKA